MGSCASWWQRGRLRGCVRDSRLERGRTPPKLREIDRRPTRTTNGRTCVDMTSAARLRVVVHRDEGRGQLRGPGHVVGVDGRIQP
eukprot:8173379-Pyramimonas_sp.AAC.1